MNRDEELKKHLNLQESCQDSKYKA